MAKKIDKRVQAKLEQLQRLEEIEYGFKEFLHGILIGAVIGFIIAMVLFG